jgi:hypothetical protein
MEMEGVGEMEMERERMGRGSPNRRVDAGADPFAEAGREQR